MKAQRTITFILVALATVACGGGDSAPTKAFQTYYSAMKNKDAKALKSVLPKRVLDRMEASARARNKSLDDLMKEEVDRGDMSRMPASLETRNEKISDDGKSATLEAKIPNTENWDTRHLVKEDDGWKIQDAG